MSSQRQTHSKRDRTVESHLRGGYFGHLQYSDEAKMYTKRRNPFGGRRMVFESSPGIKNEPREKFCKPEGDSTSVHTASDKKHKPKVDGASFSDPREEGNVKTEAVLNDKKKNIEVHKLISKPDCKTISYEKRREIQKKSISHGHCSSPTLNDASLGKAETNDSRRQDIITNFTAAGRSKIDKAFGDDAFGFKDTNTLDRGDISRGVPSTHPRSLPKPTDPKPAEKYTIVFTNEFIPHNTPPGEQSQDGLACGDGEAAAKSPEHNPNLCTGKISKLRERKFVIRREKHEAENGREEDATYTIHVCSQSTGVTSNTGISNSKAVKKVTRGHLYRQNAAKMCYFESVKPCHQDGRESANQENLKESKPGPVIKRLSSSSPPRRKTNKEVSLIPRRAQSERGHGRSRRASRRCSIRLIDHLEEKERDQTNANQLSLNGNVDRTGSKYVSEHINKVGKTISAENMNKEVQQNIAPKHSLSSSTGLASKDCDFNRKKQCRDRQVKNKKDENCIDPTCFERINIEDINKAKKEKKPYVDLISPAEETIDDNWSLKRHLQKAPAVLKKDVGCQFSPPVGARVCCQCGCHRIETVTPLISEPFDDSVAGQRDPIVQGAPNVCLLGRNARARQRMDSEGEEGEGDQIYNEEETEEEKMVGGTCSASDEEVVENSETDDGDERENNYVLRLAKKSNESNIIQADMGEDSSVCSKRTLTSSSSLTPTENVSKNNSAVKAPPGRKKNASNSFREIVERAKKRSSVNVRSLNKNSSFMKTRDPQLLGPDDEDVGHYFIGDYLHTLWKKQVLCDVRIDVNNVHFLAHKLVLAAFSDVFTPTTPYPQPTLQFTVPNSSPEAVYRVFKYIYTASMDVRDNQLEETLHVGLFLGISEIKDVILEILSQPTLENIELYIDIQNRCGIPTSLMDYPGLYQNSLMQMLHMEKFLELSTEELEVILRDPNVLVETEIDTLHALALWAQYRPLERIPEVPRLLDFIIFEVISPANIAKIVQLYDPIFTEIRSRNKISEVFRFHALQLSNGANGNMECFVENIPGIEQDPLLDRVSYIPSQGTLAKYLDRPTLRKPSMHAGLGEQAPNNLYSVRHRSVDLATLKNTPSLIGMKPSQSSLWERRHSKTRQSSSNFNESRPGSRSMKKRKSFNRSNNSAVLTQYQEVHKLSVRDTLYGNGEIFEDVENINVCRTVSGNRSDENFTTDFIESKEGCAVKSNRCTRRDHWSRSNHRFRSDRESQEVLEVGDSPKSSVQLECSCHRDKASLQTRSILSNKTRHDHLSRCSQCTRPGLPKLSRSASGGRERHTMEEPTVVTDHTQREKPICIPVCSIESTSADCECLKAHAQEKHNPTKYRAHRDAYDKFKAKALGNKNSNASSFFELM